MGKKHAALTMLNDQEGPRIALIVNNETTDEKKLASDTVRLRVEMKDGGECHFSFAAPSAGAEFESIGQPFQATVGVWIGAKVGIFNRSVNADALNAGADFDYFRFLSPHRD